MNTRQRERHLGGDQVPEFPLTGVFPLGETPTNYPVWPAGSYTKPAYYPIYRSSFEESSIESGGSRSSWNNFQHYKIDCALPRSPMSVFTTVMVASPPWGHSTICDDCSLAWADDVFGAVDAPIAGLIPLYQKVPFSDQWVTTHPLINNLINTAQAVMLKEVRPDASLVNSIIELKDFASLRGTVLGIRSSVDRFINLQRNLKPELIEAAWIRVRRYRRESRSTLTSMLSSMADVFLQWKFNISPLLRDIESVRRTLESARSEIMKIIQNAGMKRRRDYNADLTSYYVNSSEDTSGQLRNDFARHTRYGVHKFPLTGLTYSQRNVVYKLAKFHAQIEYSQYFSEWQRENAALLAILDRLGFMADPKIVWNAIPWSFVVDWFIDISQWLSRYSFPWMMPQTVVHRWCWSQHIVRETTGLIAQGSGVDVKLLGPRLTAVKFLEESYIRSNSKLNVTSALTGTGLSASEFVLGAALAGSRLRK